MKTINRIVFTLLLSAPLFAQYQWRRPLQQPVLTPDDHWSYIGFSDPSVVKRNETWHLWISGGGFVPENTFPSVRTGHFRSDNLLMWQTDHNNPVFTESDSGAWDSGHIETPCVLWHEDHFRLYYAATSRPNEDDPATLQFGLATSPDGIVWTRHTVNPIFTRDTTLASEFRWIENPYIFHTDTLDLMWYNGVDRFWQIHVNLAFSSDGIHWERYEKNPVFSPNTSNAWESFAVYNPRVQWIENRFLMLYTGIRPGATTYDFANAAVGAAASAEGIHWDRLSETPVFEKNKTQWDSSGIFTFDWLPDHDSLKMVYVSDGKLGLAASKIEKSALTCHSQRQPVTPVLLSAFPNPFNQSVTIRYQILQQTRVTLQIFNALGKLVRNLADSDHPPGVYVQNWNGQTENGCPVASGIYLILLKKKHKHHVRKILYVP